MELENVFFTGTCLSPADCRTIVRIYTSLLLIILLPYQGLVINDLKINHIENRNSSKLSQNFFDLRVEPLKGVVPLALELAALFGLEVYFCFVIVI